jgi:pyruvate dehydrogenase E2 component (dihydrolipoamide acetyltransferase)
MPDQVIMPQLGESVIEGELTKWLKQPGDWIEENEPLFEVNTDKVDTELPSPASGYLLEILVEEGAIVNAGTILAWIGEKNEPIPDLGQKGDDTNSSRSQKADLPIENALIDQAQKKQLQATAKETGVGFISPVVSRIANEHNVDLNRVKGTGSNDRITKEDILHFIDSQAQNIPSEKESDIFP